MRAIRRCLFLLALAVGGGTTAGAAQAPAAPSPALGETDRIRLAEGFRLAAMLQDSVWPGWSQAPFAVLLVTPEHEFLLRHPAPTADFVRLGHDPLLESDVYVRARTFDPALAAAFPAVAEYPTVVIGQAEARRESSTAWVLVLLHEHFHQLQMAQPDYTAAVRELDLAGEDRTGMWMLNYPFPYDSADVQARFAALARATREAAEASQRADAPEFTTRLAVLRDAHAQLRAVLPERDRRYLSFQLWQEGVARYVEYQVARHAAERYTPSPAFAALPDYQPFAEAAASVYDRIVPALERMAVGRHRRSFLYPLGAATALVLDRSAPGWKERYLTTKFVLEP